MGRYLIAYREQEQDKLKPHSELQSEGMAISRADWLYSEYSLDMVAVVTNRDNCLTFIYKRERRCKHKNVQFMITTTGTAPICSECNLSLQDSKIESMIK